MKRSFLFSCIVALFVITLPVLAEEAAASPVQLDPASSGLTQAELDLAYIDLTQGTNKIHWTYQGWELYAQKLQKGGYENAAKEAYWQAHRIAARSGGGIDAANDALIISNIADIEAAQGNYQKANELYDGICTYDSCIDSKVVARKIAFIQKYTPDGPEKEEKLRLLEAKQKRLEANEQSPGQGPFGLPVDILVILAGLAGSVFLFRAAHVRK